MTRNDIPAFHPVHQLHQRYISLTADLPVLAVLTAQDKLVTAAEKISLDQLKGLSYAEGKWTVADILQHLIDTERILSYRALRIARNDHTPLPGFDEAYFAGFTLASQRSIDGLLEEFDLLRRATIALYRSFDDAMLQRSSLCGGIQISVLALGYLIAGHTLHHLQIIRDRYLPLLS